MARKPVVEALNFKELYNKKYGDIARMTNNKMTPEQLFDMAIRYFTWAEESYIQAAETAAFQGDVYETRIHKPRIFTLNGFRLYAGLSEQSILRLRKEPGYDDVMDFIDGVIFEQKFQLAANGIVNASFIGKEIGVDKGASVNVNASASAEAKSINDVNAEEVREAVLDILDKI